VKGTKQDGRFVEGQSGRDLAERWGLRYREAHTLSIDPAALEIVDREESRRLRALPLETGPEGPVFAVAEPSEERLAAVRDIAGDNASFVVVDRERLDALLNSEAFRVPATTRRPSLFRRSTVEDARPAPLAAEPAKGACEPGVAPPEPERREAHDDRAEPVPAAHPAMPNEPLDDLLTWIATGTGNLRAQVERLTASLASTQEELREANEQLAETSRIAEIYEQVLGGVKADHDQIVAELGTEIDRLQAKLATSTALNESMIARLEELARVLFPATSAESPGA
jgi:hypothetical protein